MCIRDRNIATSPAANWVRINSCGKRRDMAVSYTHLAALLFAQRGIKVSDADADVTVKQNGIDIPVNLKYNIGLGLSLIHIYYTYGVRDRQPMGFHG